MPDILILWICLENPVIRLRLRRHVDLATMSFRDFDEFLRVQLCQRANLRMLTLEKTMAKLLVLNSRSFL